MSPTIHREGGYRFFFFSREESRPHVHVYSPDGEAKFWLEPRLELAKTYRLTKIQQKDIERSLKDITMSLRLHGIATSGIEVTNISSHGVWLLVGDRELFMSYEDFPWFKDAAVWKVLNVEEQSPGHLYWPDLDVDLGLETIENPEKFPLKAK